MSNGGHHGVIGGVLLGSAGGCWIGAATVVAESSANWCDGTVQALLAAGIIALIAGVLVLTPRQKWIRLIPEGALGKPPAVDVEQLGERQRSKIAALLAERESYVRERMRKRVKEVDEQIELTRDHFTEVEPVHARLDAEEFKPPRPPAVVSVLAKSITEGHHNNVLRAHYYAGKRLSAVLHDIATGLESSQAAANGNALQALEAVSRWVREFQDYIEVNLSLYLHRFNAVSDRSMFDAACVEPTIPFRAKVLPALDKNVETLRQILVERRGL